MCTVSGTEVENYAQAYIIGHLVTYSSWKRGLEKIFLKNHEWHSIPREVLSHEFFLLRLKRCSAPSGVGSALVVAKFQSKELVRSCI